MPMVRVSNGGTSLDVSKIATYTGYDISNGRHVTLKTDAVVGKEYLMMAYIGNNSVTEANFLGYMHGFSINHFKNMNGYTYLLQIIATATEIYNQGSIGNQNSISVSITDMDALS